MFYLYERINELEGQIIRILKSKDIYNIDESITMSRAGTIGGLHLP